MTSEALGALAVAGPDGTRAPLAVALAPLAGGGDATVHALPGDPARVAKLYRDPAAEPRRRAKLEAMLAAPPSGREVGHGGRRYVQLAWPEALVERAGEGEAAGPPAGFVMARVDLDDALVLDHALTARARRAAGLDDDYRFRAAAARNLAAAVAALHAQGHHVVDLKPSNVHVYRGAAFVAVLDCDGMSVAGRGGERFPAHQYTDGYIAPEALRARAKPEALGEAQDRFALAVVVFRLLCNGLHPFQGVPRDSAVPTTDGARAAAGLYPYGAGAGRLDPPPSSVYGAFDPATRALFDRAFGGRPDGRPTAAAWRDHLGRLLDGGLRPCPRDPAHAVFPGGERCRMCPPPTGGAAASDRSPSRLVDVARGSRWSTRRGYVAALVALSVLSFWVSRAWLAPPALYEEEAYGWVDPPPPSPPVETAPPPPPPVPLEDWYESDYDPPPPPPPTELDVFEVAEVQPELVGGLEALQGAVEYPESARRAGVEGQVVVQFVVDEGGAVTDPVVVRSPDDRLSAAALAAVRGARFRPGRQRGRPVKVRFAVPITFRLE